MFPGGLVIKGLVLSLLWLGFNLWVQELPYASGVAKKKKKKKKKKKIIEG